MSVPGHDEALEAHRASMARARSFPLEGEFDATAYVAPTAVVVGEVRLGARSSVWFGAVLRADMGRIEIGDESNVQDNSVFHVDHGYPAVLGRRVVVGHRAIVHGAVVEDGSLVGMGSVLLNGARVGAGSLVAAGALVGEGKQVPPRSLVVGIPGRVVGAVTDEMAERIAWGADHYVALAERYRRLGIVARAPSPRWPVYFGAWSAPAAATGSAVSDLGAASGPGEREERLRISLLTASDTRTRENDASGRLLEEGFLAAGHEVVGRALSPDDPGALEAALRALLVAAPDAIVVTGGSGIAPRDRAPEALARLWERELPGFGELFRQLSHAAIGSRAIASRAAAGCIGRTLVFLLPGAPEACRLALEEILVPELPHLVAMARGDRHGTPGDRPPPGPRPAAT